MRQFIGLLCLTLGSVLLSLSVFRNMLEKFFNYDWKQLPIEIRALCRIIGIKNRHEFLMKLFIHEKGTLFSSAEPLSLRQRIIVDLPLIALGLMVLGFFLSIDYAALVWVSK